MYKRRQSVKLIVTKYYYNKNNIIIKIQKMVRNRKTRNYIILLMTYYVVY